MRRRTGVAGLLLALAIGLVLQAAQDPPPSPDGVLVGVAANTQDTNTGTEQDLVKALGVQLIREEIRWSEVEPERGRFDDRRYDALIAQAARRGLRVLPLLFKSPAWLTSEPNTVPTALAPWRRFVRHVVGRYGPGGAFWRANPELDQDLAMRTWEVWNEPYFSYFSADGVDPAAYARLVRASIEAGREVNPDVGFLAAMETSYISAEGPEEWPAAVFAADPGLGRLLGGIAVHPYVEGSPLETGGPADDRFERVEALLALARRNGMRARRPVWITEAGWPTCPTCSTTRAEQAEFYEQLFRLVDRPPLRGEVGAVVAYCLRDIGGDGPADPLSNFGLITAKEARKPAWAVVRRAALAARAVR